MWNAETAQFLHNWYATPEGTYAITQENRLFQHLISQWPRRGHTLLDIGCGAGIFLEMLWHYGFDVTGLDTGTDLLDMARERLGNRAEFQLGRPEHLPFDDEEFDYAALLTVLEYVDNPEDVLREAIRVSHRGVIIGFMNSFSLYQIQRRLHRPTLEYRHRRHNLNFWSLARMVRRIRPKATLSFRSVLLGPPNTWKKEGLWGKINSLQTPLPIRGISRPLHRHHAACPPDAFTPSRQRESVQSLYGAPARGQPGGGSFPSLMDVPPLGVPPSKNDSILSRNTFGRDMAQAKGTLQPFAPSRQRRSCD